MKSTSLLIITLTNLSFTTAVSQREDCRTGMQCLLLVSVLEHALVLLMMGILLMVFNVCVVHIIDVGNRCVIVVVVEFYGVSCFKMAPQDKHDAEP